MDIEPVADGVLLDKWRRVQADITKDLEVVAQCQAGKPCPATNWCAAAERLPVSIDISDVAFY